MPDIGQIIRADDRPAAAYLRDTTTQLNVTSTSYVAGSPVVEVTFVAPTSGRVLLIVGGGIQDNSAAGDRGLLAPEIYEGADATGTLVLATDDVTHAYVSISSATSYMLASRVTTLSGLTPGATHYARLMQRSTSGTSSVDIGMRELGVVPTT